MYSHDPAPQDDCRGGGGRARSGRCLLAASHIERGVWRCLSLALMTWPPGRRQWWRNSTWGHVLKREGARSGGGGGTQGWDPHCVRLPPAPRLPIGRHSQFPHAFAAQRDVDGLTTAPAAPRRQRRQRVRRAGVGGVLPPPWGGAVAGRAPIRLQGGVTCGWRIHGGRRTPPAPTGRRSGLPFPGGALGGGSLNGGQNPGAFLTCGGGTDARRAALAVVARLVSGWGDGRTVALVQGPFEGGGWASCLARVPRSHPPIGETPQLPRRCTLEHRTPAAVGSCHGPRRGGGGPRV